MKILFQFPFLDLDHSFQNYFVHSSIVYFQIETNRSRLRDEVQIIAVVYNLCTFPSTKILPNHSLLSIPCKESGPKMHEKVQTRNCTGFHLTKDKSKVKNWEKNVLWCVKIDILYNHPDMWPFFNSASAKKLAQVVNYQVQQEKRWWWCWGDLGSSLLNGNEKPNQKWHFFCDLWWFLMISLRLSFFSMEFFNHSVLGYFSKEIFPKKKDAASATIASALFPWIIFQSKSHHFLHVHARLYIKFTMTLNRIST